MKTLNKVTYPFFKNLFERIFKKQKKQGDILLRDVFWTTFFLFIFFSWIEFKSPQVTGKILRSSNFLIVNTLILLKIANIRSFIGERIINTSLRVLATITLFLILIKSTRVELFKPLTQLLNNVNLHLDIIFILLTLTFILLNKDKFAGLHFQNRTKVIDKKSLKNKLESYWVIITIVCIGFIIRIYNLGSLSLWWDETLTGMYTTRIHETGVPIHPTGWSVYWRGIAYHSLTYLSTKLFYLNEFWLRFPSVIFGLGIALFSFKLTSKINRRIAILVLLCLIFSPYNFEYSRFARFYIMNSFLFIVATWTFWLGFFRGKLKYKIISAILFFIMLHTVQFGMIFLALVAVWGIFFIYKLSLLFSKKNTLRDLFQKDFSCILFLLVFSVIAKVGNIGYRFWNMETPYPLAREKVAEIKLTSDWSFWEMPRWELLSFFNEHHIPLSIVLVSIFTIITTYLLKKKHNQKKQTHLSLIVYLIFVMIISAAMYEFGNKGISGSRIFLFLEPFIVIITAIGLALLIRIKALYLNLWTIPIIFLVLVQPFFFESLSRNYGDSVAQNPFRSTNVAKIATDQKSIYEFLKKNKKSEDIWISAVNPVYFYIQDKPEFIFDQNHIWNKIALLDDENNFRSERYGSILLNNVEEIEKVLAKNKEKSVWLSVNGHDLELLHTTHLKEDFKNFLTQKKHHQVFISQDGFGSVFLFKPL